MLLCKLRLGSKSKQSPKLSDHIGWEQKFGTKEFTLRFRSKVYKKEEGWSDVAMKLLYLQMWIVPTQEILLLVWEINLQANVGSNVKSTNKIQ